jgi:hypothetical protein
MLAEWIRITEVSPQCVAKPQGGRPEGGVEAAARLETGIMPNDPKVDTAEPMPVGARVRMKAGVLFMNRQGTVVGQGLTTSQLRILWDGLKRPQTIARKYLEREDAEPPATDEVTK